MASRISFKWIGIGAVTLFAGSALVFVAMYGLAWAAIMSKTSLPEGRSWNTDYVDGRSVIATSAAAAILHKETGERSAIIRGHHSRIASGLMTADGQSVITVDADGNVRLTNIAKAEQHHDVSEISIFDRLRVLVWNRPVKAVAVWSLRVLAPLVDFRFRDCPDCPEMIVVPAGRFMMGSPDDEEGRFSQEGPQHRVTIAQPFAIGRYEVTLDQYADFVSATGYRQEGGCFDTTSIIGGASPDGVSITDKSNWRVVSFEQEGTHPVVCVSWHDAEAYADWLGQKTGHHYRLLSEAEWEYAARAGTSTRYSFGNDESVLGDYGWYRANSSFQTRLSGAKKPNAWGLYDMHGNVWEWVQDCYVGSYKDAPDDGSPSTDSSPCLRVVRGGSWDNDPQNLRSALRNRGTPDGRVSNVGFRLSRTLNP